MAQVIVDMEPRTLPQTIDSASVNQSATNFSVNLGQTLDMSKSYHEVSLSYLAFWNVQQNISESEFNNSTFEWAPNSTGTYYTGVIPDGIYSASTLIGAISDIISAAPTGGGPDVAAAIELFINQPTVGFGLNLSVVGGTGAYAGQSPAIDFSAGGTSDLYLNLGFDPITYATLGTTIAPFAADILNGVSGYQVFLDCVGSSYSNGILGTSIFSFAPVNTQPGAIYVTRPAFPIFYRINQTALSSLGVRILDQLGRTVQLQPDGNFQNNATVCEFAIRRVL